MVVRTSQQAASINIKTDRCCAIHDIFDPPLLYEVGGGPGGLGGGKLEMGACRGSLACCI